MGKHQHTVNCCTVAASAGAEAIASAAVADRAELERELAAERARADRMADILRCFSPESRVVAEHDAALAHRG